MIEPMLATDLDPSDPMLDGYLRSDRWIAELKYDGQRVLITMDQFGVHWQARSGLPFDPKKKHRAVHDALMTGHGRFPNTNRPITLDGEALADGRVIIFDVASLGRAPLEDRLTLSQLFAMQIGALPPRRAITTQEKIDLLSEVRDCGYEGIVLKRLDARYSAGRSTSWLKVKITATADLMMVQRDATSCTLMGMKDGHLTEFGRAAIYPNVSDQMVNGLLVEVRYLYVSEAGRLVQPRILNIRTDKSEITNFNELRQRVLT